MKKDVTGFDSFIGVDLHKCTVTLRAVSADGESIGQLKCDTKCGRTIEEWIKALPGPIWLAVEACPFVEWFIDRFRPASIASTSPTPRNCPCEEASGGRTTPTTPWTSPGGWLAANARWATSPTSS